MNRIYIIYRIILIITIVKDMHILCVLEKINYGLCYHFKLREITTLLFSIINSNNNNSDLII